MNTDEWHDFFQTNNKNPVIFTQLNARAACTSMNSIGVALALDLVVSFNMCKFNDMMCQNSIHISDTVHKSQNSHTKRR